MVCTYRVEAIQADNASESGQVRAECLLQEGTKGPSLPRGLCPGRRKSHIHSHIISADRRDLFHLLLPQKRL